MVLCEQNEAEKPRFYCQYKHHNWHTVELTKQKQQKKSKAKI